QEGVNGQYLRPHQIFGQQALLTAGANLHSSQIVVGLFPAIARVPNRLEVNRASGIDSSDALLTRAHAAVTNTAGYIQQSLNLLGGHLRLEGGLRFDYFHYNVSDGVNQKPTDTSFFSGVDGAGRFQPKAAVAYTISDRLPLTFYVNYGRGINSQDARGVIQQ